MKRTYVPSIFPSSKITGEYLYYLSLRILLKGWVILIAAIPFLASLNRKYATSYSWVWNYMKLYLALG